MFLVAFATNYDYFDSSSEDNVPENEKDYNNDGGLAKKNILIRTK